MSENGDGGLKHSSGFQLEGKEDEERGVGFNMHSPGEEAPAALSAGAPVWPL